MEMNIQPTSRKTAIEVDDYIVAASLGVSVEGEAIDIRWIDRISAHLTWSGTPTGSFSVEGSNDKTHWVAIPMTVEVLAEGVANDAVIDIETAVKYVRLKYTRTSGTGSLTVKLYGKSISR
jgi:hypothetical protein